MNRFFRKFLSLSMALLIALSVFNCAIPNASAVADYDTDGDGTLEILALGNSFTEDSLTMVYSIATDLGIENVHVAYLFYTGASLKEHVNFAKNKSESYTYRYCNNSTEGEWKSKSKQTIDYGLTAQSWDYIMIQETSGRSGVLSYYEEDLGNLIDYIKKTVTYSPKLVWNMTWAYQQDYENSVFDSNYGGDQMTMYNAILNAVSKAVVTNSDIDIIVPAGTAIQNVRTAWYGDTITRDGYHLSYGFGRYVAALTVVKAITGLDVSVCTARPHDTLNGFLHELSVEAVNNAINAPFEITDSIYSKDDYVKITPQVTIGKYWSPTNSAGKHNDLFTSNKYACFERLTADEIPAGSIIWLEKGWKYRPIGWNGTEKADSTIPWVTDAGYLITTDEFWNNYTTRSFNIVHPYYYSTYGTNQVLGDADIKSLQKNSIVVIYVPKSTHVHRIVDNVCTLCGYESLDHTHDYESAETKSATCTEPGEMTYTCACGNTYTEEITANGHALTAVKAKAPTCYEAGYEAYEYCTACDYTTFKSIDSINHEYSEYRIEKEPTCDEYGVAVSECIHGCGLTVSKPIKPLSHNYVLDSSTPATCGYDATETYICEYCDTFYTIVLENTALEHSFTDYEELTVPTCGSAGVEVASCDHGCGATDEKTVPAREHLFLEYIYNEDATCKEDGTKTAVCVYNCGETHTETAEDTKLRHVDEDADKICDECESEIVDVCDKCGDPVHESEVEAYICIVISLIKLINSFMNEVIIPLISIMMEAQ